MARQDVREALVAMEADEDVRARLAAADFDAVERGELTDEERTLVQDAASDMPEVSGFAMDMFLKINGIEGESKDHKHGNEIFSGLGDSSIKWKSVVQYGFKFW